MNIRWLVKADGSRVLQENFNPIGINAWRDIPEVAEERKAREWVIRYSDRSEIPFVDEFTNGPPICAADRNKKIRVREVLDHE